MFNQIKLFGLALGLVQTCAVVLWFHECSAQMNTVSLPTQFFLEKPPTESEISQVPPSAREVIVAKVRLAGPLIYLVGRDQSGQPPPPPKDLFLAPVEIVDVLAGKAATGERYDVYFGVPRVEPQKYKYPHTPSQKSRDYFVVSYIEEDMVRRLVGVPLGEREFEVWKKEVSEYEGARGRPGARD
jgi:hypothetical protein